MNENKSGFTLIELLVVIFIIGLLSTISIVSLNSARARSRDARRLSDIKNIQIALEMYYNDVAQYPATISTTTGIRSASTTYINAVPEAPTPNDGTCTLSENSYTYNSLAPYSTYTLTYCLGANVGSVLAGINTSTPFIIRQR